MALRQNLMVQPGMSGNGVIIPLVLTGCKLQTPNGDVVRAARAEFDRPVPLTGAYIRIDSLGFVRGVAPHATARLVVVDEETGQAVVNLEPVQFSCDEAPTREEAYEAVKQLPEYETAEDC